LRPLSQKRNLGAKQGLGVINQEYYYE